MLHLGHLDHKKCVIHRIPPKEAGLDQNPSIFTAKFGQIPGQPIFQKRNTSQIKIQQ